MLPSWLTAHLGLAGAVLALCVIAYLVQQSFLRRRAEKERREQAKARYLRELAAQQERIRQRMWRTDSVATRTGSLSRTDRRPSDSVWASSPSRDDAAAAQSFSSLAELVPSFAGSYGGDSASSSSCASDSGSSGGDGGGGSGGCD